MSKSMSKVAFVVAVLAFAACSADSKPAPGTSGNAVPSASSSSSSSSDSSSVGPSALNVMATEPAANAFTFDTGGVESLAAGPVLVTFTNGGTMAHELRVVRVRDGNFSAYRAAVLAATGSFDALGDEVAKSPSVDRGKTSTFGAELTPGAYALVCFLPAADGKVFAQLGMMREFTVS
jgi:hypothetical protein